MLERPSALMDDGENPHIGELIDSTQKLRSPNGAVPSTVLEMAFQRGAKIGRYILTECIGEGGMGVVYCALDPDLNRKIALKFFHLRDDAIIANSTEERQNIAEHARQRLIAEAKAAAAVAHPNVVSIYDVGEFCGRVYVAMEFVEGETLKHVLRTRPVSWKRAIGWMTQAARGLLAVHERGLVHADFKPDNLILGRDSRVRLLDFGLAQNEVKSKDATNAGLFSMATATEASRTHTLVAEGTLVGGTPTYMAPEQHQGKRADARSDQYAFFTAVWELCTGERPFVAPNSTSLAIAKTSGPPKPTRAFRKLPKWLQEMLRRGLAPNPEARHASMRDVNAELEERAAADRTRVPAMVTIFAGLFSTAAVSAIPLTAPDRCGEGARRIDAVWTPDTRNLAQASFSASGLSYGDDSFARVDTFFREYTEKWRSLYLDQCERSDESSAAMQGVFELRMSCFASELDAASRLAKAFENAGARTVENAVRAVSSVQDPTRCASMNADQAWKALPDDPATKERVVALRSDIADLLTLRNTGQIQEALERVEAMDKRVQACEHASTRADGNYAMAEVTRASWEFERSSKYFERAFYTATAMGDSHMAAQAAHGWLYVRGYAGESFEALGDLFEHSMAVAQRSPDDAALSSSILNAMAATLVAEGRSAEAESYYQAAIHRLETPGETDTGLRTAAARMNLGMTQVIQKKLVKGERNAQIALRAFVDNFGESHPEVVFPLNNVALALQGLGRFDDAFELHTKAREIVEGKSAHRVARGIPTYHYNAQLLQRMRKYNSALIEMAELSDLFESSFGPIHGRTIGLLEERAIVALANEDTETAKRLVREVNRRTGDASVASPTFGRLAPLRARIALLEGDPEAALREDPTLIQSPVPGSVQDVLQVSLVNHIEYLEQTGQIRRARREIDANLDRESSLLGMDNPNLLGLREMGAKLALNDGDDRAALNYLSIVFDAGPEHDPSALHWSTSHWLIARSLSKNEPELAARWARSAWERLDRTELSERLWVPIAQSLFGIVRSHSDAESKIVRSEIERALANLREQET